MSEEPAAFDWDHTFDERLREVPNDPVSMGHGIDWLCEQLERPGPSLREQARLAGQIGAYGRMLGRDALALAALQRALRIAMELGDQRLLVVNMLRLAHLEQWQGRFEESTPRFAWAIQQCEEHPELAGLLDTAYQHAGKNAFDQGQHALAHQYFSRALELRRQKGDPELLRSTEHALAMLRCPGS